MQDLGADQQFAFGIEEAELELQLELRDSGKGDGRSASVWRPSAWAVSTPPSAPTD
ncbi:trypco2 family protein [Streptomyces sp. NBC_00046]|uniref:trypco2 family protein n=1 Tax=unclassified Streptomyces TaxID=2593676 RepID=UPI003868279F